MLSLLFLAACFGKPPQNDMPTDAVFNCTPTEEGSKCVAKCNSDTTTNGGGSWESLCTAGSYEDPKPADNDTMLICNPHGKQQ